MRTTKHNLIAQPYVPRSFLVTGVAQCRIHGAWCEVAVHETVAAQGRTEARTAVLAHVEAAARRLDAGAIVRWHTPELAGVTG